MKNLYRFRALFKNLYRFRALFKNLDRFCALFKNLDRFCALFKNLDRFHTLFISCEEIVGWGGELGRSENLSHLEIARNGFSRVLWCSLQKRICTFSMSMYFRSDRKGSQPLLVGGWHPMHTKIDSWFRWLCTVVVACIGGPLYNGGLSSEWMLLSFVS